MSNDNKDEETLSLAEKIKLKIKDFYYLHKQGETLEHMVLGADKGSRQRMGKYGPKANVHLNVWSAWEVAFNEICDLPVELMVDEELQKIDPGVQFLIRDLAEGIWQSSASLNGFGLTKMAETLGQIQNPNIIPEKTFSQPTAMDSKD